MANLLYLIPVIFIIGWAIILDELIKNFADWIKINRARLKP